MKQVHFYTVKERQPKHGERIIALLAIPDYDGYTMKLRAMEIEAYYEPQSRSDNLEALDELDYVVYTPGPPPEPLNNGDITWELVTRSGETHLADTTPYILEEEVETIFKEAYNLKEA